MAQANRLTNAILAPFTGAGHKPSTCPIGVEYPTTAAEGVARGVL
jgi:hypothetical protein